MEKEQISLILKKQRDFFGSNVTLPLSFRRKQLKKLYDCIKTHRQEIENALFRDLGKSPYESFMCEIGLVLTEISFMLKNIGKFSSRKHVHTPLSQFPSVSFVQPVPYGNVLIMSPWNYPFLLTIDPLVDAIAAGNTAILKPSAYSPATSEIISLIISECFPPEYVSVITGGRAENTSLLEEKFDMIFFTGSQEVGRIVMEHAAKHLTPVVLELGGKSPCIVDESADIPLAARRIVFGKFLNCGQTCVAPDFIICHESVHERLVEELKLQIRDQYGKNPLENDDYGCIINQKHFQRLTGLINSCSSVAGGKSDPEKSKIAPCLALNSDFSDEVMQEEIFGPILPILTYSDFDDLSSVLKSRPKPLALYIFSHNRKHINRVINEFSYGGGCINDTLIHLATSEMGFGGVGESGMGSYHGKNGFDAFSHKKSIVDKKTFLDLPMRYQPYTNKFYKKLLQLFLR